VIQTEGAPLLQVTRSGSSVLLVWPFPSFWFVLQQTTVLTSPPPAIGLDGCALSAAVQIGSDWTVTIPSPPGTVSSGSASCDLQRQSYFADASSSASRIVCLNWSMP